MTLRITAALQLPTEVHLIGGLVGFIVGWIVTPNLVQQSQNSLAGLSSEQLGGVVAGSLFGSVAAALLAIPLGRLPHPVGQYAPIAVGLVVLYLSIVTLRDRPHDLMGWLAELRPNPITLSNDRPVDDNIPTRHEILLDTSVIIDGRITDISKTGFLTASLTVPNFVLVELQHIADSADPIRRKRGRRGLEVLNVLRTECPIPFEISDIDVSEVREVDSKLVALARHLNAPIMTNDYNLNRVAGLQGVTVLNINDLASAVKAAYLPGEELTVKVIQEGRESGQGVGYLDDGTMVVVEEGRRQLNRTVDVVVTKVLQTSAGRMIFAKINF
ncbi:MAG: PIN/TRAM domain-containing protein [Candidatus Promineifilaceae bacterium]